ncbi:MAG: hypothetical protein IMZ63_02075, partial [Actinobacteria bacterium]|nr:hypothetical protein [Actinomycetota bacterium]
NYPHWKAQVVLDPVEDKTYENALAISDPRINVKLNETRNYNLSNFLEASSLLSPDDEDVIAMIDADDWLANNNVLSIVKNYYETIPDLLVTHGSWAPYPKPNIHNNRPYSEQDFEIGVRKTAWRASHLRTCKYKIWKNIKKEDLQDENGNFFTVTGDLALMFPLIEMAGYPRVKFIPEILYIYNQETTFSDDKLHAEQQRSNEQKIRTKKSYPLYNSHPEAVKYHLGCGSQYLQGYINVDFPQSEHSIVTIKADIYSSLLTLKLQPSNEIKSHHVFEHFSYVESLFLLFKWAQSLTIGGFLKIGIPDIEVLNGALSTALSQRHLRKIFKIIRMLYGSHEAEWAYHVNGWTEGTLSLVLEKIGFKLISLEKAGDPNSDFPNCSLNLIYQKMENPDNIEKTVRDFLSWYCLIPAEQNLLTEFNNQFDRLMVQC